VRAASHGGKTDLSAPTFLPRVPPPPRPPGRLLLLSVSSARSLDPPRNRVCSQLFLSLSLSLAFSCSLPLLSVSFLRPFSFPFLSPCLASLASPSTSPRGPSCSRTSRIVSYTGIFHFSVLPRRGERRVASRGRRDVSTRCEKIRFLTPARIESVVCRSGASRCPDLTKDEIAVA
jgi:hypothetical protein